MEVLEAISWDVFMGNSWDKEGKNMGTWLDMGNIWEDNWMIFWEIIGNTLGMHMDNYGIVMG
jgi:hypothetical protein